MLKLRALRMPYHCYHLPGSFTHFIVYAMRGHGVVSTEPVSCRFYRVVYKAGL